MTWSDPAGHRLRQNRGNQSQAARLLGINRVTVWNRIRCFGIHLKKL